MFQLYSSILDKLPQPINEETAVVLSANTWLESSLIPLLSILCSMARHTRNVLFTHMEQKQIIMRYIECVLKLFGAFLRQMNTAKEWKKNRKTEESFTNLFPPICYIEFPSFSFLSAFSTPANSLTISSGNLPKGRINVQILFSYFVRFLPRPAVRHETKFPERWKKVNQVSWQRSLFVACPENISADKHLLKISLMKHKNNISLPRAAPSLEPK